MSELDQYLAEALSRGVGHSPLLDWLIGTVLDLPSLKMLPLVAAENWRRPAIHPRKDTDRTMSETRGPDRAFQKARAPAVSLR
jgi:hypothetical protein